MPQPVYETVSAAAGDFGSASDTVNLDYRVVQTQEQTLVRVYNDLDVDLDIEVVATTPDDAGYSTDQYVGTFDHPATLESTVTVASGSEDFFRVEENWFIVRVKATPSGSTAPSSGDVTAVFTET